MEPTPPSARRFRRPPAVLLAVFAVLLGWIFFLRWPTLGVPLWNVDEAIHAAVARTLLDGGVLYRDAVDQRTPLTYYAVALIFEVFGENNLWAVRAAVAALTAGTAFGLVLLGRRAGGAWSPLGRTGGDRSPLGRTGAWSALIFCALTTNLLYPADNFSASTEWFVIFFTTWGTWWFWRTLDRPGFVAPAITGGLFGLAVLSKQPALLDLGAPVATLLFLALTGRKPAGDAARAFAGIVLGFLVVNAASCAWAALHGAFGDMVFYTCAYNLLYYGSDITALDRVAMAFVPFQRLATAYPLVLGALLAGAGGLLFRVMQRRPAPEEQASQPWAFYLLAWSATSLTAAAASGRLFEHYYVQCLPAFSLAAGWLLARACSLVARLWRREHRPAAAVAALAAIAAFVGLTGFSLIASPLASRGKADYPHDPGMAAAHFISALTTPRERIFVWGYNADFYLYTNRKPASRFTYCSFQTGLIPWTNLAKGRDTTYAIVPGTMQTLLTELEARRPVFFVDCSVGKHRNFQKYPLSKFPALESFVERDYVEAESGQFVPEGFRLHLIRDSARRRPLPLAGGTAGDPAAPELIGSPQAGPTPTPFIVVGHDPAARLQRLELRVGDDVVDSASFQPTDRITIEFAAPFERLGPGHYRVTARAVAANGRFRDSPPLDVACAASVVPRDQLPAYRLPCVTTALLPVTVQSPFKPMIEEKNGHRLLFLHAPSVLHYPLPENVRRVQGGFGFREGAYTDNPSPTDGAEFLVELLTARGERRVLYHRLLRPLDHPEDRPIQSFVAEVPPHAAGGSIEFVITTGPAGNGASDWTFWTDLQADTSR